MTMFPRCGPEQYPGSVSSYRRGRGRRLPPVSGLLGAVVVLWSAGLFLVHPASSADPLSGAAVRASVALVALPDGTGTGTETPGSAMAPTTPQAQAVTPAVQPTPAASVQPPPAQSSATTLAQDNPGAFNQQINGLLQADRAGQVEYTAPPRNPADPVSIGPGAGRCDNCR